MKEEEIKPMTAADFHPDYFQLNSDDDSGVKLYDPPPVAEIVPQSNTLADQIFRLAHDNDMQIWDGLVTEKTFDQLYTYAKGLEYALECLKEKP